MKRNIWNVVFSILLLAGVVGFAYRNQINTLINGDGEFHLTKVPLKDMLGYRTYIEEGPQGFVVFYSDLKGCATCLGKIGLIKDVSENYGDVGYYAILKERDARERFGDMMSEYQYPGEHLHDPEGNLQKSLGLSNHPALLFFDREGHMIANMPLDVDHEQLLRQFYRYMEEM